MAGKDFFKRPVSFQFHNYLCEIDLVLYTSQGYFSHHFFDKNKQTLHSLSKQLMKFRCYKDCYTWAV